ncbi:MAG: phosphate acyltransferase [Chlorobi bacterium]|nr:phosphate acyltransferase [Chlorobiota bacterium]
MIRIGLDVMGGDYAPGAILSGAWLALRDLPHDVMLVLIGKESVIRHSLKKNNIPENKVEVVNAPEVIEMGDHPARGFTQKTDSSIVRGFKLLSTGQIDAFASAGNTGAMLVGTTMVIKTIPGVIRPTIATTLPNIHNKPTVILDVGINPDSKPDVLYQYGFLGSLYARYVYHVENPRVALLNIGAEETKGNLVVRSAYELMKDTHDFNFIGNIESNEFFTRDKADVVVCDGFVGNIVIKEAETVYAIARERNISDPFFDRFNFENYGGTPILGINKNVVIAHGISNKQAIHTMIFQTWDVIKADLVGKIKKHFSNGK